MKIRLITASCATLYASIFTATAQLTEYSDDFNTGTDTNWVHWAPPPATASFGFPTNPASAGNSAYELAAAPGTSSFFTTARAGSYVSNLTVQDFLVTVDLVTWAPTNEIQQGVMARVQTPILDAGAFPGTYGFFYINRYTLRTNGTDQLRIYRLGPNDATFLNDGLGGQGQFSNPGPNSGFFKDGGSAAPQPGGAGYRLFFYGRGNTFRGQIMDLSTGQFMTFNDGNGNLTNSIHGTDPNSTFATGSAGVITVPNTLTPGTDTVFDNFSAGPIPAVPPTISQTALAGDQIQFSFNAESNRTYNVDYRTALDSGSWTLLTNFPASSTDTNWILTDPIAGDSRFYRVRTP